MDRTDEELLDDYLGGNEEAFSVLVERHLKTVYTFVIRFVGDQYEAEDIVQETFLKCWKSAKQYKKEASKFKTWALRIARNTAIDHLRKRKHVPISKFENEEGQNILLDGLEDPAEHVEELFAKMEDAGRLREAMERISPEQREILLLHYQSGLTFLQIGEMTGEPQNTVKSRHHRALGNLRKILKGPPSTET